MPNNVVHTFIQVILSGKNFCGVKTYFKGSCYTHHQMIAVKMVSVKVYLGGGQKIWTQLPQTPLSVPAVQSLLTMSVTMTFIEVCTHTLYNNSTSKT